MQHIHPQATSIHILQGSVPRPQDSNSHAEKQRRTFDAHVGPIGRVSRVIFVELEVFVCNPQIYMTNHRLLCPRDRTRMSFGLPQIGQCGANFSPLLAWRDFPEGQFEGLKEDCASHDGT